MPNLQSDLTGLARQGKVRREQAGLLARLVRMAEEDGQLESAGGSNFRWNQERLLEDPVPIWRALFEDHPHYQAELLLLAQRGEALVPTLRGQDSAESSQHLPEQMQDTSPFQAHCNQIASAVLTSLVANWPADRPMRILQIGGAGLAAWVLPTLPPERADFLFTDLSEAAIARAEHRFAAYRFARFAGLDLSRDLLQQDQPAGYFDLVLAAGIGAESVSRASLARLKAVMAPGAQLLILEANPDRFTDLVLGRGAPLRSEELAAAGFQDVVSLDDSSACPSGQQPQQSVLLARLALAPRLPQASPQAIPAQQWMLLVEGAETSSEFTRAIAASLTASNQQVSIHAVESGDLSSALAALQPQHLVYIAQHATRLEAPLLEMQQRRSMAAVHLVQVLEATRQHSPCDLTFVTRGAFPTGNGQGPLDPGQSPLWGIGRVITNEHSGLNLRMIDLHSTLESAEDASWLAEELLRRDEETEVQLSAGFRYANREQLTTLADESRHAAARHGNPGTAFALGFEARGGLDSLCLRAADRKAPAPHEIEIAVKAAGLNFRDVLWSMGMLPEEAVEHGFSGPTIGMECSGEVVRTGSAVTGFQPGDRVVAFASSCFASHVTTDSGSAALLPAFIGYAAAATIPTAFLTAYYAFDYLARLQPGETVLIHGAAGGVGLAAVQIAKMKGAKIIGTAGSTAKRRMLEMLGVDHVLNSRTLEFADQVMDLTGGIGVDVVLNSLAGEAITRSLQCLRPFGRFLEIGKRDLYANSRIGLRPFRNNLSYFGIDADTLLIDRPALARSIFQTILDHFAAGRLRPLPFQAVPISRAAEAFRAMQQSRHVGKLVVSLELDRPGSLAVVRSANPIRSGVTYIVSGGLGGFGLSTARWLAKQGATSLALLSRRGAVTEEATEGVTALQALGATVQAFAVDIADTPALEAVLATVRAQMQPLAGVFHSAAVIEDAPILNISEEQFDRVFRPKLLGAWNLHQATFSDALDIFALYSSSSAVIGNPGQGAYVAANLYLDSLALYRRSLGLPALSIGWGAIKDAGFLTRHQAVAGMLKARTGLDATPAGELLTDLGRLLAAGATRVSVARFDLLKLAQMLPGARVPRFLPIVPRDAAASLQAEDTLAELLKNVPPAEHRAFVLARVREHAARVLGTSAAQVIVDKPLADLGLDSLMAVELAGGLERDLGQPVSVMQLLSATSLTAIAELIMNILGVAGTSLLQPSSPAAPNIASGTVLESVTR